MPGIAGNNGSVSNAVGSQFGSESLGDSSEYQHAINRVSERILKQAIHLALRVAVLGAAVVIVG